MGAGGALFDFDADGDLDVLLVQGGTLETSEGSAGGRRLFRNDLSGPPARQALHFTDVTADSGFDHSGYGMGATIGDYDNDGDPDVYFTNYGPNRLYRNEGRGAFLDVTRVAGAGLDDARWSTSGSFTDYDADGDLDLFFVNYVDYTVTGAKACYAPTGARDYCGPRQFRPTLDRLFRNNGNGTFSDVTEVAGIAKADGPGLGVVGADFNADGSADFYVANDGTANQMWLNKGDGTFVDDALLGGTALNGDGAPEGSMGIAADDPDNDGDLDLFVTNIARETHAYYRNLGEGRFADARVAAGVAAATAPFTGFGTGLFDLDNDRWLDLFVANGAVTLIDSSRPASARYAQRNQLLRNIGQGVFRDITGEAGEAFAREEVSRGAAFGDIDNDGDVDVLVTNNNGPARLLLNETAPAGNWLLVQLQGIQDNRHGIGARVALRFPDGTTLWRHAHTDGSYLSSNDPRIHFGLAGMATVDRVMVVWPRGLREEWQGIGLNRIVTLKQGTGTPVR